MQVKKELEGRFGGILNKNTEGFRRIMSKQDLNFKGIDLSYVDLEGAKMARMNLTDANLEGADFTNVSLRKSILDRANLKHAILRGSKLDNVSFRNADLEGATFKSATVNNTDFTGANLKNVNFFNCQEKPVENVVQHQKIEKVKNALGLMTASVLNIYIPEGQQKTKITYQPPEKITVPSAPPLYLEESLPESKEEKVDLPFIPPSAPPLVRNESLDSLPTRAEGAAEDLKEEEEVYELTKEEALFLRLRKYPLIYNKCRDNSLLQDVFEKCDDKMLENYEETAEESLRKKEVELQKALSLEKLKLKDAIEKVSGNTLNKLTNIAEGLPTHAKIFYRKRAHSDDLSKVNKDSIFHRGLKRETEETKNNLSTNL